MSVNTASVTLVEPLIILKLSPLPGSEKIDEPVQKHHTPKLNKQIVESVMKRMWNFLNDIFND